VNQQIDTDGQLHDVAPAHERLRLFMPAPTQIAGQTSMTIPTEEAAMHDDAKRLSELGEDHGLSVDPADIEAALEREDLARSPSEGGTDSGDDTSGH